MAYDKEALQNLMMRLVRGKLRLAHLESIEASSPFLEKEKQFIANSTEALEEFVARHRIDPIEVQRVEKLCAFLVRREEEIDEAYYNLPIADMLSRLMHSFVNICLDRLEYAGRLDEWESADVHSEKIMDEVIPGSIKVLNMIREIDREIRTHLGFLIDKKPQSRF